MDQSIHSQLLGKARSYKIPLRAIDLLRQNPPIIISGTTASGKDEVLNRIVQISDYRQVVTHTTRVPRTGEINARHYHFVSEEQMLKLADNGHFLEMQDIHGGTVYGTSLQAYNTVIGAGHKPLVRIDIQGIEEISKYIHGLRPFFLLPPSFEAWMERLDKRGHMSHVEKIRRFKSALIELEEALRNHSFVLVINRDVNGAAEEILRGATDSASQHHGREIIQQLIDHIHAY